MPFRSEAQRAFMFANHPQLAKEFQAATPKGAKLPRKIEKRKRDYSATLKGLSKGK